MNRRNTSPPTKRGAGCQRTQRALCSLCLLFAAMFCTACDMTTAMSSDQTTAISTIVQNIAGFFFDFSRQLIAAFIF